MISLGDVIRMAREAGIPPIDVFQLESFEDFAALVAAAERERLTASVVAPHPDKSSVFSFSSLIEFGGACAAAEREACAKLCEAQIETGAHIRCANAIRARGNP